MSQTNSNRPDLIDVDSVESDGIGTFVESAETVRPEFRAVAQLIPKMDYDVREAIAQALWAECSYPSESARRLQNLALFVEFFSTFHRICTTSEYRAQYDDAVAAGRNVVSIGKLEVVYGTFANAQDHAARLCLRGTAARVPFRDPDTHAKAIKQPVTPDEGLDSIERLAEMLGHWPSDGEYRALSNAQKTLNAAYGATEFEFVTYERLKRLWKSVGEATAAAQRRLTKRMEMTDVHARTTVVGRTAAETLPADTARTKPGSRAGKTKRRRPRGKRLRMSD